MPRKKRRKSRSLRGCNDCGCNSQVDARQMPRVVSFNQSSCTPERALFTAKPAETLLRSMGGGRRKKSKKRRSRKRSGKVCRVVCR